MRRVPDFSGALDQRHHRRDAAAAAEQQHWQVALRQHESAGRRHGVDRVAFGQRVVEPVGAFAAGDAFHRHLELAIRFGRARQRVAAVERTLAVRHAEGQELAGLVSEFVGKVGRHIEHEGPGVGSFLDDFGDAQGMISH